MATANTRRIVNKKGSDLYNTPKIALNRVYDIFKDEWQGRVILEPCCGIGGISIPLIKNGLQVKTNELYNYPSYRPDYNYDFLNLTNDQKKELKADWIVSNPPYKLGLDFVMAGFDIADKQILLLRTSFLEGKCRYEKLYKLGHLESVFQFVDRISCTKGENKEYTNNAVSYMWFYFNRNFVGDPKIRWLRG